MRLRFDPTRRLIVLPATVIGPAWSAIARMALDTGSTNTILNSDVLRIVGIEPATPVIPHELVTASVSAHYPEAHLPRIEALGKTAFNLRVACLDLPGELQLDGLLGMDFLAGSILTIDFKEGIVDLT